MHYCTIYKFVYFSLMTVHLTSNLSDNDDKYNNILIIQIRAYYIINKTVYSFWTITYYV